MSLPTLIVEIAWSTEPLAAPTWTDESSHVRSLSVNRGRQDELGEWEAGTLTVVLSNAGRRFEPFFTGSPLSPNVIPRRRIRVRATATTTHPVFDGFITDISPEYPASGRDAVVTIEAADAFSFLAQLPLRGVYEREILTDIPKAWYRLNEAADSTVLSDSSGNGRDGTVTHGALAFGTIDPITDGVDGAATFDGNDAVSLPTSAGPTGTGDLTISVWLKPDAMAEAATERYIYVQQEPSMTPVEMNIRERFPSGGTHHIRWTFGGETLDLPVGTFNFADGAWHLFHFTREPVRVIRIWVDGADRVSTTLAGTYNLGPEFIRIGATLGGLTLRYLGSMDELAIFPTKLAAARILAHFDARNAWDDLRVDEHITKILDQVSWPGADRDLAATLEKAQGAGDLGGINTLDAVRRLALTEDAPAFVARDGKITQLRQDAHRGHRERSTKSQASFADAVGDARVGAGLPRNQVGTAKVAGNGGYTDIELNADWEGIKNVVTLTRRGGNRSVQEDAASVAKYGRLALQQTTEHSSDTVLALAAGRLLTRHRDPSGLDVERLALTLDGSGMDESLLGLELFDKVAVQITPPGGGAVLYLERQVQGISHQVEPGLWSSSLELMSTP